MDIKNLMTQMKSQFEGAQKKLETFETEGESGGENGVRVQMNGHFKILDLKINFLPNEKEDLEILEDMVKKALDAAYSKVADEVKRITGGMR